MKKKMTVGYFVFFRDIVETVVLNSDFYVILNIHARIARLANLMNFTSSDDFKGLTYLYL